MSTLTSQSQSLNDWLCFIEQSHPIEKIELGLARVQQVAERGQLHQLPGQVILLAGTNGKGTTARTLELMLEAQGKTVGVYTSPHLLKFNERLRIAGVDVSDALWVQGLTQVQQLRQDIPLTYFEFTTLAAFAVLKAQKPDVCIIEVGLGGRLDATNIVSPDVSVITTIDLDHQDWLGPDRESIGREKAGIFRPQTPVVIGDLMAPLSVSEMAAQLKCPTLRVNQDYGYQQSARSWQWQCGEVVLQDLIIPQVPVQNVATAFACLSLLHLLPTAATANQVLGQLQLAGRMQWLSRQPAVLLDVAHNPQSAQYLSNQLQLLHGKYRQIHLIAGMLKDKDIQQALQPFVGHNYQWHLLSLPGARGAHASQLQAALPSCEAVVQIEDLNVLQRTMHQAATDELWVVFGSFVTVAEFLQQWTQDEK